MQDRKAQTEADRSTDLINYRFNVCLSVCLVTALNVRRL